MWAIIAICLAAVVGGLGVLLFKKVRQDKAIEQTIQDSVDQKVSGWIARELQRRKTEDDASALDDFTNRFGRD